MATVPSKILTKTVRGVRKYILYYDPELFDDTIILSASLLIGADLPFDAIPELINENGITHYNTIHDEDAGSSGTDFKPLIDIAIPIYPKPKSTKILGVRRVEQSTSHDYHIDSLYDTTNLFTYEWDIDGDAAFDGASYNVKTVTLDFGATDGKVILKCKITNPSGCYRYIIKTMYIGLIPKELLVVRNTYF